MDINRIRYFNIVAETGSLVKASEVLHISQPALSKAIKLLESETGLNLVEADGRGLRLTENGKRFRDQTRPLVAELLEVPKKIRQHENMKSYRIASFEVFTTYFLGHVLKNIDLSGLEIHEFGPGRMEMAVAEGRADLAVTYLPVPRAGIEFTEITKIKMGIFGRENFMSDELSGLPFVIPILPAEGTPSKIIGIDGWPDHIFERRVQYRVTMMESALELCREGIAVGYFPEFVVHLHNKRLLPDYRLQEFKCPIPAKDRQQSVFLVRRQGTPETSLDRKIANSLRSLK